MVVASVAALASGFGVSPPKFITRYGDTSRDVSLAVTLLCSCDTGGGGLGGGATKIDRLNGVLADKERDSFFYLPAVPSLNVLLLFVELPVGIQNCRKRMSFGSKLADKSFLSAVSLEIPANIFLFIN